MGKIRIENSSSQPSKGLLENGDYEDNRSKRHHKKKKKKWWKKIGKGVLKEVGKDLGAAGKGFRGLMGGVSGIGSIMSNPVLLIGGAGVVLYIANRR